VIQRNAVTVSKGMGVLMLDPLGMETVGFVSGTRAGVRGTGREGGVFPAK
jgi:hypothetical protein